MVTTSDSYRGRGSGARPRCGVCSGLARGRVLLLDANGVRVGFCHWTRSQRLVFPAVEFLPEEVEEPFIPVVAENKYPKTPVRLGGTPIW